MSKSALNEKLQSLENLENQAKDLLRIEVLNAIQWVLSKFQLEHDILISEIEKFDFPDEGTEEYKKMDHALKDILEITLEKAIQEGNFL